MTAATIGKNVLRIGLCGLAVWVAFHSVALHDSLTLADNTTLTGTITETAAGYAIQSDHAATRGIAREAVAIDADGAARVSYGVVTVWRGSKGWLLAAAVCVFLTVPLLQAVRLRALLCAQGVDLPLHEHIRLAFVGNFMNYAAPLGSTAGDVYKAFHVARRTDLRVEGAAIVLLDRAVGLGTLLASVALIACLAGAESRLAPLRGYLVGMTAVGMLAAAILVTPAFRRMRLMQTIAARLPQRERLTRVDRTARAMLARPRALLAAIGITLVLQILAAATFLLVALGLGFVIPATAMIDLYAYFSAGEIVKAIPGPPQGLGTMELAYRWFFGSWAGASQIVSAALAIRLVGLVCAMPGAWLAATSRVAKRESAAASRPSVDYPAQATLARATA